jgi:hypothetical protein
MKFIGAAFGKTMSFVNAEVILRLLAAPNCEFDGVFRNAADFDCDRARADVEAYALANAVAVHFPGVGRRFDGLAVLDDVDPSCHRQGDLIDSGFPDCIEGHEAAMPITVGFF